MKQRRRIAIIGGGVGGLAASIALDRAGIETTVFERSAQPSGRGAALWLTGNAVQALGLLGLENAVSADATEVRRQLYCSWSGETLWQVPLDQLSRRPVLLIGRDRLESILHRAVDSRRIRWRAPCCGFAELEDRVRPLFLSRAVAQSGESFDGLIGADGFRSAIRRQLLGPEPKLPRSMAWAGLAETPARFWPYRPGDSVHFVGRNRFMVTATLADRPGLHDIRRVAWYLLTAIPPGGGVRPRSEVRGDDLPPIAKFIEASNRPIAFHYRDRHPSRRWGRGRVTLLGDAIHPARPEVGQGAAQALVGAVELARHMEGTTVVDAFRAYERCHRPRTASAARLARLLTLSLYSNLPDAAKKLSIFAGLPLFLNGYRKLVSDQF